MTPNSIQNLISNANVTSTGVVSWEGDGGLESILTYINENSVALGIKIVDNTNQLGLLGGSDAALVSVKNVGLFRFNANNSSSLPNSVAGQGGVWQLETSYQQTSKYQKIFGNGTDTTFYIQHNLNNQYPNITIWDITSGNPELLALNYVQEIHSINANEVSLVFNVAPLLNQYLISIQ